MFQRILFLFIVFILLLVAHSYAGLPGYMKYRMGTIEGQVVIDGEPIAEALLAFFDDKKGLPPIPNGLTRIPDYTARSGPEGKFGVQLPQGSYYLGILRRSYEAMPGPPRLGEVYYFADGGNGTLRSLSIADYKKENYGKIQCALPDVFTGVSDHFTVKGVVLEAKGHGPLYRAMVLAKRKPEQRRPDFVSEETSSDGKFTLKLPLGETFYLAAREKLTGVGPKPGDSIGKYSNEGEESEESPALMTQTSGGPPPEIAKREGIKEIFKDSIPINGKSGEVISGIEIYMYKMPDRQAIKESLQGTDSGAKLEVGTELNNIFFAVNSSELEERSFEELDLWANFLKSNTDVVEVSGHTDNIGDAAYNKVLSEKRAQAVADYLKEKGVPAERIVTVGYGAEHPVEKNDTAFGRERNRRVEVRFLKKK